MTNLPYIQSLLIVCPLVFLAGFIDSIAGGGGLLSLPAWLATGLPAHMAAGSNKFANMIGTSVSVLRYGKNGNIRLRAALTTATAAIPGAFIGTKLALYLDATILKLIILGVIPIVTAFVLSGPRLKRFIIQKKLMAIDSSSVKNHEYSLSNKIVIAISIGLVLGAYDGLIGPGTGTFLILAFTAFMHYSLVDSSGSSKVVNLTSNIISGSLFIVSGNVWYAVAIPAAACAILGNLLGSHFAIRGGSRVIRPIMILVLILLCIKIAYDLSPGMQ